MQTAMIYLQFISMFFYHPDYTMETILAANSLYLNGIVNSNGRTLVPLCDDKPPGASISTPGEHQRNFT